MAGKKTPKRECPVGTKFSLRMTSRPPSEGEIHQDPPAADITWIADLLVMSRSTIDDWLSRMHRGGLDARYECERPDSLDSGTN